LFEEHSSSGAQHLLVPSLLMQGTSVALMEPSGRKQEAESTSFGRAKAPTNFNIRKSIELT
jgi:hypothetical protein